MNASMWLRLGPALLGAALLAACGSSPTAEPAPVPPVGPPPSGGEPTAEPFADDEPASAAATAAPAPTTEPVAPLRWSAMNDEQKRDHMKAKVVPKMGEVFGGFDAAKYGKLGCATCHGAGAKEGKFEMPTPSLPKLPKEGKFDKLPAKVTEFMKQRVVPEMASLLDMPPYDPATKQGFGCYGCHTPKP